MATVIQPILGVNSVGEGNRNLIYTSPAAGTHIEVTIVSGLTVSIIHCNGAENTIYSSDTACETKKAIHFGPLASGDKIIASSAEGEPKVHSIAFQFDTV